jgi:MGT family glycosyltransferase
MRIAFAAPAVPGHLNPMTALARKIQDRGHEIIFIAVLDAEPVIRAAGLQFFPFCQKHYPPGELARLLHQLSLLSGDQALHFTFELFANRSRAGLEDGPRALRESKAEACVFDAFSSGLDLVALRLGIPYVQVSNALHFDFSGRTPLCIYDWPHAHGPEAYARNQKGIEAFLNLIAPMRALEREWAEDAGLNLDWSLPAPGLSKLAWLTQTPREFDFPGDHYPEQFHYTGPLHDGHGRIPSDFPWDRLTGDTLIYASMGTLQNGSEGVFRIIAAAASAPGRQVVLSIGQNLDPDKLTSLAPSTIVVKRAPQIDVLKRASLCITHAGLNTALESLACGVPMVAIPVTNDQPGVAARIAHTHTGAVVPLKDLSVERLRTAIDEVLGDGTYRENAARLQKVIQSTNGLEKAADLILQAFAR